MVSLSRSGDGQPRRARQGLDGLSEPTSVLDLGNSGTGMRLLAGLLAGQDFFSVLTGDRISESDPCQIVDPLQRMGAKIDGRFCATLAPLSIRGAAKPLPYRVCKSCCKRSGQVAVLLAGLYANGETTVNEPSKSRDHTERMFRFFGVEVREQGPG